MILVLPNEKRPPCPFPHSITSVTKRCCLKNSGTIRYCSVFGSILAEFITEFSITQLTNQPLSCYELWPLSILRSECFWKKCGCISQKKGHHHTYSFASLSLALSLSHLSIYVAYFFIQKATKAGNVNVIWCLTS